MQIEQMHDCDLQPRLQDAFARARSLARFQRLARTLERLAATESRDDVLRLVPESARGLCDADGATLALCEGQRYYYVGNDIPPGSLPSCQRLLLDDRVTDWALQGRQPVVIHDVLCDNRVAQDLRIPTLAGSLIVVPVGRDKPFAALRVYWSATHQVTAEVMVLLETLARATGAALYHHEQAQRLRSSEERLRLALDAARMNAFEYDISTGQVQRSGSVYQALGLDQTGPSEEYFAGIHPDDRKNLQDLLSKLTPQQPVYMAEYRFQAADGSWRWLLDHARMNFTPNGQVTRLVGVNMDVTERRHTEDTLKASLAEKEVMLQEIHHRVKNNLQVVSSLMRLQRRKLHDPALQAAFNETEERVRAMALVHERMYRQHQLASLDFAAHIRELAQQLLHSFGMEKAVQLCLELQPLQLPLDTAVPLTLVVTELVTNALKHAVQPRGHGMLTIALEAQDDKSVKLTVADDGPGLPPNFDANLTTSLGLRLVRTLANQIDARLETGATPRGAFFTVHMSLRGSVQHSVCGLAGPHG